MSKSRYVKIIESRYPHLHFYLYLSLFILTVLALNFFIGGNLSTFI